MPRSSSLSYPLRTKARKNDARLFSIISSEIKGARGRCAVLLSRFHRDQRRGRTTRGSSPSFPPRTKAREDAAQFFSPVSTEIKDAGERRGALLPRFHREQRRGRTLRGSSLPFPPRSKAREDAARLFSFISTEIKGAGERCAVLLSRFHRDRRCGRTTHVSSPSFPPRSKARENDANRYRKVFVSKRTECHQKCHYYLIIFNVST